MEIVLLDREDLGKLDALAECWIPETVDEVGPRVDKAACLAGVARVMDSRRGDVLALVEGESVAGLLCLEYGCLAYSDQTTAKEKYFYILPRCRGRWSGKMRRAAELLAQWRGCRHIVFTISAKASADADRIQTYFERSGYRPFERSLIKELD